ncbi:hypothetical protein [Streptomyces sp. NPDC006925]|uniref:hypothetical protein n=1 Tax=Streptomyces sp. NPDC006925 TaxID=3364768 RepID=UPI00368EB4F3
MANPSGNEGPGYTARLSWWIRSTVARLVEWTSRRELHTQFAHGAAQKLGSGAVTVLILWWETRH